MSDTGGGHRASANALRDAFDTLHPNQIQCDIVDIYTDYGPFWPFNWYVPAYKIMAEYSFLWKGFYEFGSTELGLWLNELVLDVSCLSLMSFHWIGLDWIGLDSNMFVPLPDSLII